MMMKLPHNPQCKLRVEDTDSGQLFQEWKHTPTMQSPCGRHKFQLFQKWKDAQKHSEQVIK
jgi:hypothetical protein